MYFCFVILKPPRLKDLVAKPTDVQARATNDVGADGNPPALIKVASDVRGTRNGCRRDGTPQNPLDFLYKCSYVCGPGLMGLLVSGCCCKILFNQILEGPTHADDEDDDSAED